MRNASTKPENANSVNSCSRMNATDSFVSASGASFAGAAAGIR